jgi:hypothetical protein
MPSLELPAAAALILSEVNKSITFSRTCFILDVEHGDKVFISPVALFLSVVYLILRFNFVQ